MLSIDEAIAHARAVAETCEDEASKYDMSDSYESQVAYQEGKCGEEHEQLAEWLEELKELREYKKRMEMQDMDDINNPLEPLKLVKALESEIFKYNYRKEHKPQDINILDYTVMYALKHCLEEQLKAKNNERKGVTEK